MSLVLPLLDVRGRPLRDLRISVMDRCNFRCPYCMPEATYGEHYRFLEREERLTFAEILRIARVAVSLGVTKVRLTGGEPLLRPDLPALIAGLRDIAGIEDLALTTNGVLLAQQARALRDAGLDRVTVSLDTLDPAVFHRMSGGRGALQQVLEGIQSAQAAAFPRGLKINTVVQRGVNDAGVLDLVNHFRGTGITLRLIEYMDVGNRNQWRTEDVVSAKEMLARIHSRWPIEAVPASMQGEVATRFRFLDGQGEIGVIASVTAPFCGDCVRARVSSEGMFYTCLFAARGTDLRGVVRDGEDDGALRDALVQTWQARADRYSEQRADIRAHPRPKIEMHYIGG